MKFTRLVTIRTLSIATASIACWVATSTLLDKPKHQKQLIKMESLWNLDKHQWVSEDIANHLLKLNLNEIEDMRKQGVSCELSTTFASIPIHLNSDGVLDKLVYPQSHHFNFHGAHAIRFWLFETLPDQNHRLLLTGQTDLIVAHESFTNNHRDMSTIYNSAISDRTLYRFHKSAYEPIARDHQLE